MNTTITPQSLGALIKRTGISKSERRNGRMYSYNTEGYSLTKQYDNRYTLEYYSRFEMALPSDAQREAFQKRHDEALRLVIEALQNKKISHELRGTTLWIKLETEMAVA